LCLPLAKSVPTGIGGFALVPILPDHGRDATAVSQRGTFEFGDARRPKRGDDLQVFMAASSLIS